MKIAVLGSGAWGTALSLLLQKNGHEVTLWSYCEEECSALRERGENKMLPGVPLPESLPLTHREDVVAGWWSLRRPATPCGKPPCGSSRT